MKKIVQKTTLRERAARGLFSAERSEPRRAGRRRGALRLAAAREYAARPRLIGGSALSRPQAELQLGMDSDTDGERSPGNDGPSASFSERLNSVAESAGAAGKSAEGAAAEETSAAADQGEVDPVSQP